MRQYELSTLTFEQKVLGKIDTVILPIGTIEAHGPHCPLGTDALIPVELAERVEALLGEDQVLIAPPVNYGHSWYLGPFPGTVDVSIEVLGAYLTEIGRSFLKWGLKNIILLNGHGGNAAALSIASERLADAGATTLSINWWVDYKKEILEICTAQGHAGEDETATVMAIRPEWVDLSVVGEANYGRPFGDIKAKDIEKVTYPGAYSSDPKLASVEKGQRIVEAVAQALAAHVRRLKAGDFR